MAVHRTSWTTKPAKALTCASLEEANRIARSLLGSLRALDCHFQWSSSQHGYVIYNAASTKMVADR